LAAVRLGIRNSAHSRDMYVIYNTGRPPTYYALGVVLRGTGGVLRRVVGGGLRNGGTEGEKGAIGCEEASGGGFVRIAGGLRGLCETLKNTRVGCCTRGTQALGGRGSCVAGQNRQRKEQGALVAR